MSTAAALRGTLDDAPMSRAQVVAVAITFALSALDGYDVLAVTFAAPAISIAWDVGKGALGMVLSAGLLGMALGAFLIAPLADVVGRRAVLLGALALMATGMLLCASAPSLGMLACWRVLAGLGIGACVAVINPVAAEFANRRRRPLTVSVMAVGYPVGGVLGGLLAAALLHWFDWRVVFLAGAAIALAILPAVWLLLPESPAFLLARPGPRSLSRVNAVLLRFGHPALAGLGAAEAPARRGYAALLAPGVLGTALWLAAANLLYVLTVYYMLSWLPQMIADAGHPPSSASLASAVANLAGVAGGVALGWRAQRGGLRALVSGSMAAFGVSVIAFGAVGASLPLLIVAAAVCGFFLFGSACGVYATIANAFGDEARASGTGLVSGVGRISSALAPLAAGRLFEGGMSRGEVSAAFGACALISAALLAAGWKEPSR